MENSIGSSGKLRGIVLTIKCSNGTIYLSIT
ncbi:DUF1106 domain-containing protein, partial [Escherichia coli]